MSRRHNIARSISAGRRLRETIFGRDLFSDPVWDILLDLYRADGEGIAVKISSVGAPASIAPTTSLRWLSILLERGIVIRESDPGDARRVFIRLSPSGLQQLEQVLDHLALWLDSDSSTSTAIDT